MSTPTRISALEADRLARGLHRRQILSHLARSGLSVEPAGAPDRSTVRDAENRVARLSFAADGAIRSEVAGQGATVRRFDSDGRLIRLEDPGGLIVTTAMDPDGARRISRGGHGDYVVTHDPFGLVSRIAYPDGGVVRFDHDDPEGETVTDQAGRVTRCARDADGKVTAVTDRNGNTVRIAEGFRAGRRVMSVTTPAGSLHEFGLGGRDELTDWAVNGAPVAQYQGAVGDLPQRADFSDGHWVAFDAKAGRIVAGHNPHGSVRLTHDKAGRLMAEDQNGLTVSYERDRTGLLTAIVLPDGERVCFAYDGGGRLSEVTDWSGAVTRLAWAANGQMARIDHPNGVSTVIESNALGLATRIDSRSARDGASLAALALSHDAGDRVMAMAEGEAGRRFRYDPVGRLVAVEASEPGLAEAWRLDAMGNRRRDNGVPWSVDADNRIGAPDGAIAYDALGRTTSVQTPRGRAALRYNGQGQLTQAVLADGTVADYAYDAFGRRLWKRVNGTMTRFLWAGQTLLCEWIEGEAGSWRRRDHLVLPDLFLPLAMRVDGRIYRQHTDHRSAPLCLTDEDGRSVWRARLKAFGEAVIAEAAVANPWRLVNQYADDETGLHYNLARYLHPQLGRYLTPDPAFDKSGGGNFYLYAAGDPINRSDPTGEILPIVAAVLVGAAVGAVIGAAVKTYEVWNEEGSWGDKAEKIGKAALLGGVIGAVGGLAGLAAVAGLGALGIGAAAAGTGAAVTGTGAAAGGGIGSALIVGAVEGAISSVAEACAEAKAYDKMVSGHDLLMTALIGGGIGMVTAGIGGLIAARAARKARQAAREAEVLERLVKKAEKEAAEQAEREATWKAEALAREAGKTPAASVPSGIKFGGSNKDAAKRAVSAFPHTQAAKISRELEGKSLEEIKRHMAEKYPDIPAIKDPGLPVPPGQSGTVEQTKWVLPDGTVVRVKETNPSGGAVDEWGRSEPTLSVSLLKRDPNGNPLSDSYQNEAFKVSGNGEPVPKGPSDVDKAGLSNLEADKKTDELMDKAHRSIRRDK